MTELTRCRAGLRSGTCTAHLATQTGINSGEPLRGLERIRLLREELLIGCGILRLLRLLLRSTGTKLGSRSGQASTLSGHTEIAE